MGGNGAGSARTELEDQHDRSGGLDLAVAGILEAEMEVDEEELRLLAESSSELKPDPDAEGGLELELK